MIAMLERVLRSLKLPETAEMWTLYHPATWSMVDVRSPSAHKWGLHVYFTGLKMVGGVGGLKDSSSSFKIWSQLLPWFLRFETLTMAFLHRVLGESVFARYYQVDSIQLTCQKQNMNHFWIIFFKEKSGFMFQRNAAWAGAPFRRCVEGLKNKSP